MLRCSKEAFTKCSTRALCGCLEGAAFVPGSECDKFNRMIEGQKLTNGDRIRGMSDEELAARLYGIWNGRLTGNGDISRNWCDGSCSDSEPCYPEKHKVCIVRWLKAPMEK